MNSLYDTMMLEKTCSETELKQRYYELTRHYNPNSKNGSYDKYLEVVKAYNILKDSYKRHFYDTFGESGLQNIEEARKGYFLTRTFDHVNLKLVTVAIILLILNISFLPLSLYLHQKTALSFTTIFTPAMMAFVLIGLFVYRSFVYCKRYTMERMGNEMTYMAVIGVINLLFLLQTIIMCCVVDLNMISCKYLWLAPYIIFECLLFAKYLINKPEERSKALKNLWPRMSRLICMHMFLLDTKMKYKIFIPLKLAMIEMYARKMTYKTIMATGVCIFTGLLGVFVCIEPPCRWVAYILGALYIAAGIICVVGAKKAKQKYAPRCRFGKQPMIDYEV